MMKFIVIGDIAVLTTRDLIPFGEEGLTIEVSGIPSTAKASITIQHANENYSYRTALTNSKGKWIAFIGNEQWASINHITISWVEEKTTEDGKKEFITYTAKGNDIEKVTGITETSNESQVGLMPRISARAVEVEEMWRIIANAATALLPILEKQEGYSAF